VKEEVGGVNLSIDELKDAFLCHNSADEAWVQMLGERLEAETIDGFKESRRITVFYDEWDIDIGDNVLSKINEGLRIARYLVAVMTPEFFRSGWANIEWTDVVAQDPWEIKKRLIPILLRDVSVDGSNRIVRPAPFKIIKYLDFREKPRFEEQFQKLLRRLRGLPPQRGGQEVAKYSNLSPLVTAEEESESWKPDRVRDVLLSNMLEVKSFPRTIWSAETEKESSVEVRQDVPDAEGHIIRSKRLWTFADLSQTSCRLRGVVNAETIGHTPSRDWMLNEDKKDWWMALINQALTSHLSKIAVKKDQKDRFFFRPNKDGTDRTWQNGEDRPRTVAAAKTNPVTGGRFWVHHAARIKFTRLGSRYFLMIDPTYLFTLDGEHLLGGQEMGRMVMMWGGKQKNPDILRSFVFWAKTIARNQGRMRIKTGGSPIIVSGIPAGCVASVGVEKDYIRIGSLLRAVDTELDEAAQDVEVVEDDDLEGLE
jgi:hypothetical protein